RCTLSGVARGAGGAVGLHASPGAAGDATEVVLSALEAADRERAISGRRFCYEHGFGLTERRQIDRVGRLGMIVAANPLLAYFGAARSLHMSGTLGRSRAGEGRVGGGFGRA